MNERRQDSRFSHAVIDAMRAVLRPGRAVSLINLSAGGALIESQRPLRPGSSVHLQLVTGERSLGLAAQVLRCAVAAIGSAGVLYRGALAFSARCDALWESQTLDGYLVPDTEPIETGTFGHVIPEVRKSSHVTGKRVEL